MYIAASHYGIIYQYVNYYYRMSVTHWLTLAVKRR